MDVQDGHEAIKEEPAHEDAAKPACAPKKRLTATFVINLTVGMLMAGMIFSEVVGAFVRVGISHQSIKCLPGTVFAIRQSPPKAYKRGQMIAYRSLGLAPLLPDGQVVAKLVAGLPGDQVEVTPDGISINGSYWGPLNATVLEKSGKTAESVTRTFKIPKGELLLLGTLPRSYDGRYWGTVKLDQVIGQAWTIW